MLINDVLNKEELSSLIIGELKELGVKYRKDKKQKTTQEKGFKRRIFRTHLHLLELTDVILANGAIVQIPQFVADACQRILEQVQTEGLFRKAGSSLRQKEIRLNLEAGLSLGRAHHVIDVANVLKSFFRELPEPLLLSGIQEALLRSLLIGDENIKAILMTCLLLPPLTINTLAFFMQFLNTVSLSCDENKMSVENLAIIFTPGLMPLADITSIRFNNHVKVIQILIENAEMIGVLPDNIVTKLHYSMITPSKTNTDFDKKKKKRRSGSLTRMFNGLKKMVGAIGSSEDLDNSTTESNFAPPCLTKSAKKRKIADANSAFSAKKKKEILEMLPDNGGPLPNTPMCTKENKNRLSLGGRRNLKYTSNLQSSMSSMEHRWSVVGPWSRKRQNTETTDKKEIITRLSPVVSMSCISNLPIQFPSPMELKTDEPKECNENNKKSEPDYVRISKSEYEDIKERVSAIETRLSQELGNVRESLIHTSVLDNDMELSLSGPERVLNKFEKTIEETESMTPSPGTENLAKRLSRELKIRRSGENRVIRSPSARKIGTIRRRSRENVRLSRNQTWHISSTKYGEEPNNFISVMAIYPKANLKRGRPNTLNTGLPQPSTVVKEDISKDLTGGDEWTPGEDFFDNDASPNKENVCAKNGKSEFSPVSLKKNYEDVEKKSPSSGFKKSSANVVEVKASNTPNYVTRIAINETKTPMLPPRSIPRKVTTSKTPNSVLRHSGKKIHPIVTKFPATPMEESQNGRASIARLRAQNAGMVMAKAKLFDGLGMEIETTSKSSSLESRRTSQRFAMKKLKHDNLNTDNFSLETDLARAKPQEVSQRTPKRRNPPPRSPGCIKKRQKFSLAKHSNKNILENINENTTYPNSGKLKNTAALRGSNIHSPTIRHSAKMRSFKVNSPRHQHSRIMRTQSAISIKSSK